MTAQLESNSPRCEADGYLNNRFGEYGGGPGLALYIKPLSSTAIKTPWGLGKSPLTTIVEGDVYTIWNIGRIFSLTTSRAVWLKLRSHPSRCTVNSPSLTSIGGTSYPAHTDASTYTAPPFKWRLTTVSFPNVRTPTGPFRKRSRGTSTLLLPTKTVADVSFSLNPGNDVVWLSDSRPVVGAVFAAQKRHTEISAKRNAKPNNTIADTLWTE